QEVQLHRLGIDFTAVVEQHPLAQPEGPGAELLVGLPALGDAGDDVALLIDIRQAGVYQAGWMGGVELIMTVPVEAGRITTRAIVQGAAPFRMPLCRLTLGHQPTQSGTDQHRAGGEERSAADVGSLSMSV